MKPNGEQDTSEKLLALSDTQILQAFQRVLVAIYPTLVELDCISDDSQPYDPFDRVATALWNELVLRSLQWKYGLNGTPELPPYGFTRVGKSVDGTIRVKTSDQPAPRFVAFVGDRDFGDELFNAVVVEQVDGCVVSFPLNAQTSFSWDRPS